MNKRKENSTYIEHVCIYISFLLVGTYFFHAFTQIRLWGCRCTFVHCMRFTQSVVKKEKKRNVLKWDVLFEKQYKANNCIQSTLNRKIHAYESTPTFYSKTEEQRNGTARRMKWINEMDFYGISNQYIQLFDFSTFILFLVHCCC